MTPVEAASMSPAVAVMPVSQKIAQSWYVMRGDKSHLKGEARRIELSHLRKLFATDLAIEHGVQDHPKVQQLFDLSWELSHSEGHVAVAATYSELKVLLLPQTRKETLMKKTAAHKPPKGPHLTYETVPDLKISVANKIKIGWYLVDKDVNGLSLEEVAAIYDVPRKLFQADLEAETGMAGHAQADDVFEVMQSHAFGVGLKGQAKLYADVAALVVKASLTIP